MTRIQRFIDIGANLTDLMYAGIYNGSKKHEADLGQVLQRSWDAGVEKIIITGGNVEESKKSLEMAKTDARLYSTVGCHPTKCSEFEQNPEEYFNELKKVVEVGGDKIVAIGECGLDYERVKFCPIDTQKKYFEYQLKLSEMFNLPLFLHCRDSANDLYDILKKYTFNGVVHSFDGTFEEADKFISMGYFIGLNGCSLKTKENLETVSRIPTDRILLETDCPWCEIRPTHAGYSMIEKTHMGIPSIKKEKWKPNCMVKGRNEPCNIRQVLDIIATVKNEDPTELSEKLYVNTINLFKLL